MTFSSSATWFLCFSRVFAFEVGLDFPVFGGVFISVFVFFTEQRMRIKQFVNHVTAMRNLQPTPKLKADIMISKFDKPPLYSITAVTVVYHLHEVTEYFGTLHPFLYSSVVIHQPLYDLLHHPLVLCL